METEPLPEPKRHTRFHQRMDALAALPSIQRRRAALRSFREADQLRRAINLHEVMGPRKGLQ